VFDKKIDQCLNEINSDMNRKGMKTSNEVFDLKTFDCSAEEIITIGEKGNSEIRLEILHVLHAIFMPLVT
jgi:hypothetical protein